MARITSRLSSCKCYDRRMQDYVPCQALLHPRAGEVMKKAVSPSWWRRYSGPCPRDPGGPHARLLDDHLAVPGPTEMGLAGRNHNYRSRIITPHAGGSKNPA